MQPHHRESKEETKQVDGAEMIKDTPLKETVAIVGEGLLGGQRGRREKSLQPYELPSS